MSLLAWFENASGVTEAFVSNIIVEVKTGGEIAVADFEKVWNWLAAHSQEISSDAATVADDINKLKAAGITIPSTAITAINEFNVAVNSLNAAVAVSNTSGNAGQIVAAAYAAAKTAQAAVASAGGDLAAIPVAQPVAQPVTQGTGA